MTRIFVYGTLRMGQCRNHVLSDSEYLGGARTKPEFTMWDLGPYPAVTNFGADSIAGEVYEVDERTLAELDRIEGHPRLYRRTDIELADGQPVQTYLYACEQGTLAYSNRVPSGDWCQHTQQKNRA